MPTTKQYIATNRDRFLDELMKFLRIKSVGTSKEFDKETLQAAKFVQQKLTEAGADRVQLIDTIRHPLVYGEKIMNESLPTVLVYGHYDVQPADPYALWDTPPFEPTIKNEKIYARGASDDKGQAYIHIKALEVMLATDSLPCNVKFLIEGEEESGSEGLNNFLRNPKNHSLLGADALILSDTAIISLKQPSVTVGLRGIAYLQVEVEGPNRDLHSGVYGGAVGNPINILCRMIAALQDEQYRITIPGFYDRVEVLSDQERAALAKTPFNLAAYEKDLGVKAVMGETGYSTLERAGIRPSLDVNGIWGGYTGEGGKTVLPSKAFAKISMRLVPHQEEPEIIELFTKYFTALAPEGVNVRVEVVHEGSGAILVDNNALALQATKKAFEEVWGKAPVLTRDGGSIPIMAQLQKVLGCDIVFMGFGLDSDNIHSPNEHFGIDNFFKGLDTVIAFYKHLAVLHQA